MRVIGAIASMVLLAITTQQQLPDAASLKKQVQDAAKQRQTIE